MLPKGLPLQDVVGGEEAHGMGHKGLWIQVGVLALRHPKTLAAGPVAGWLWIASIGFAREHMTDGFIAKHVVPTLLPYEPAKKAFHMAAKLVEVGLYDDVMGGFQLHDYLEWNPSKAELDAQWESDRRRKESKRNPDGIQKDNRASLARAPSDSVSDSSPVGFGSSEKSARETAPSVLDELAEVAADAGPVSLDPPAWGQRGPRPTAIDGDHLRCVVATKAACPRGVCVPVFLGRQWLAQLGGEAPAEAHVRAFVSRVLARVPPGPIAEDPLKFWRAAWQAEHVGAANDDQLDRVLRGEGRLR